MTVTNRFSYISANRSIAMNASKLFFVAVIFTALALAFSGCSNDSGGGNKDDDDSSSSVGSSSSSVAVSSSSSSSSSSSISSSSSAKTELTGEVEAKYSHSTRSFTADVSNLGGSGTISYQWQKKQRTAATWEDIVGENGEILNASNLGGNAIRVRVSREDNSGFIFSHEIFLEEDLVGGSSSSSAKTVLTGKIRIITSSSFLTADDFELGGSGTISYQWQKKVPSLVPEGSWEDIVGETNIALSITNLIGQTVRVRVSREDNIGFVYSDELAIIIGDGGGGGIMPF